MKKNLLRVLWTCLALSVCVVAVALWLSHCPEDVEVNLGAFASLDAGNRASIKRLSREIQRCPNANTYEVHWYVADPKGRMVDYRATMYSRALKPGDETMVGYEDDIGSGFAFVVAVPNASPVHEVAAKNGTFTDFKKYEVKPKKNKRIVGK